MSAAATYWHCGGATVRGPSHGRSGKPNEDAIGWSPPTGEGVRILASVSDGHGAEPHFRSDTGSRLAVDRALELIGWHLDDVSDGEEDGFIAADMIAAWRQAVDADLHANPIEGVAADSPRRFVPYGATLLAAGLDETAMTLFQLGDGDLMLGWPDGRITRPLGEDDLVGEQTYSLCLDGAETHVRLLTIRRAAGDWPDFVSLSTDGVSKSFPDDAGFEAAIRHFRAMARSGAWATLLDALPGWLSDVTANGSGDDCTLCLLYRPTPDDPTTESAR